MEALVYFILWAGLFFLMMRFGCGGHILGHGHGIKAEKQDQQSGETPSQLQWSAPETDIDPVCMKTVQTASARPTVHDGQVYYFCSRDCRDRFEAAPHTYLAAVTDKPDNHKEQVHA